MPPRRRTHRADAHTWPLFADVARAGRLSQEIDDLRLIIDPREATALIDTCVFSCYEDLVRSKAREPAAAGDFVSPRVLLEDLARAGTVAMSYASVYEVLNKHKGEGMPPEARARMHESLAVIRASGVRIVEVDQAIFRLSVDLWYDVRQGRVDGIQNTDLMDPLIVATGLVSGVHVYTVNWKHFEPYCRTHGLQATAVAQRGRLLSIAPKR